MAKKALITGITGQDGAYLAEVFTATRVRSPMASTPGPLFSTPNALITYTPTLMKKIAVFLLHYGRSDGCRQHDRHCPEHSTG